MPDHFLLWFKQTGHPCVENQTLVVLNRVVTRQKVLRFKGLWSKSQQHMQCPSCQSTHSVKNGRIPNRKPKFACKDCSRQCVEHPENRIRNDQKEWIDKRLLERIPRSGIAQVVEVSERWLQTYVNQKYRETPRQVQVKKKPKGKLVIQCDELWSFVGNKENKQWVWLAIDQGTGESVGVYVGDRRQKGAQGLWESYQGVLPTKRHHAVGKGTGQTNTIEHFNATLRPRVSRLARKALSFSKTLENPIGAIWYFAHHDNQTLSVAAE